MYWIITAGLVVFVALLLVARAVHESPLRKRERSILREIKGE